MTRGWWLTAGVVLVLVGGSFALPGAGDGRPGGLGVPALLYPVDEARHAAEGVAARSGDRLDRFLAGRGAADSLVLDERAVAAVLRERLEGRLPAGVADARVELRGPTVVVSARIRFDSLDVPRETASRLRRFLGDSTRVEVEVEPSVEGAGNGRLVLRDLRAGGFSLPSGLAPFVLSRLGVKTENGEETAVRVPLPGALTSITVGRDRIVLFRSGGT